MHTLKQPVSDSDFKDYYHFRWSLLRQPWQQIEGSEIDAIENQCFHIMAVTHDEKIVGVGRLQFNSINESQIRYMAVEKPFEGQGIGRLIIQALETRALENHLDEMTSQTVILDARENAVGFYKKMGYRIQHKSHLLYNTIQHFRMSKTL